MRKEERRRATRPQVLRKKILGTRHALNCPECARDADAFVWLKSKDTRRYRLRTLGPAKLDRLLDQARRIPADHFYICRKPCLRRVDAFKRAVLIPPGRWNSARSCPDQSQKSKISFRITFQAFPPRAALEMNRFFVSRGGLPGINAESTPARTRT